MMPKDGWLCFWESKQKDEDLFDLATSAKLPLRLVKKTGLSEYEAKEWLKNCQEDENWKPRIGYVAITLYNKGAT